MGVYKKAIITDAGEALRARAVAGEASMQFSHAKTSTHDEARLPRYGHL